MQQLNLLLFKLYAMLRRYIHLQDYGRQGRWVLLLVCDQLYNLLIHKLDKESAEVVASSVVVSLPADGDLCSRQFRRSCRVVAAVVQAVVPPVERCLPPRM